MKRLRHIALVAPAALVALAALAAPAYADVTIKSSITGKGMGISGTVSSTTYLKGNQMRNDTVTGDTTRSTIFDLDTQKMISFQEMNIKMGGEGPMAGLMAKMGNMSSTTTVTSIDAGALAADLFAPPAGYKLKEQR